MKVIVDSAVLLRTMNPNDAQHVIANESIRKLAARGEELCLVPQVLYECWVVLTRPLASNGLGWTSAGAAAAIRKLRSKFTVLHDDSSMVDRWLNLVEKHDVKGKPAHDTRLVAAMEAHGVTHLATFNASDFQRFVGVTILDPATVA